MVNNFTSPKWTQQELDAVEKESSKGLDLTTTLNTLVAKLPNRSRDAIRKKINSIRTKLGTIVIPPPARDSIPNKFRTVVDYMMEEGFSQEDIAEAFCVSIDALAVPEEPPKQEEPQQEDTRIEIARAIRAGETTFEELALKYNTTLDYVERRFTPFFKKELGYLQTNYGYIDDKTGVTPLPDRITTNILKAFKNHNDFYKAEELHEFALNG